MKRAISATVFSLLLLLWLVAAPALASLRLEPSDYIVTRIGIRAVAFESQALATALSLGRAQTFEITGQVLALREEGEATVAELQTEQSGVLIIRFPQGCDLPQAGEQIRLLTRLQGESNGQASMELLGFVGETELAIVSPEGDVIAAPPAPPVQFAPAGSSSAASSAIPVNAVPNQTAPAPPAAESAAWPWGPATPTPAAIGPSFPYWAYTGPSPYAGMQAPALPAATARVAVFAALIKSYNRRLNDAWAQGLAQALLYYCDWYGVHPALGFALVACESSWNPNSVSHTGAMGLGQLMPGTARGLGVGDAFEPMQNLHASMRLLRGHLEKYQGRPYAEQLALALACYNAGSGAVQRYGGIPPYSETINYIRKVSTLFTNLYNQGYR